MRSDARFFFDNMIPRFRFYVSAGIRTRTFKFPSILGRGCVMRAPFGGFVYLQDNIQMGEYVSPKKTNKQKWVFLLDAPCAGLGRSGKQRAHRSEWRAPGNSSWARVLDRLLFYCEEKRVSHGNFLPVRLTAWTNQPLLDRAPKQNGGAEVPVTITTLN